MADYYTLQQASQTLGITEARLAELQKKGLLVPTVKDGRSFLSSQQLYRLRVAIRWARKVKNDLNEVLRKVDEHWVARSDTRKV